MSMEIIDFDYLNTPLLKEKIVLCLGYFDGVHRGHQKLIEKAKNEGYKVAVLTFDNSPNSVMNKLVLFQSLSSISDKAEYFENLGVDYFLLMHFDLEVSKLTKDQFIDYVIAKLNPVKIYCGEDYTFGVRKEGNGQYLQNYYDVEIFPLEKINNKKISSRDIIEMIHEAKFKDVYHLLGRYYRVTGLVVEGNHKGRTIQFPTANLSLSYPYAFPKIGVYMGYAIFNDDKYKAIIQVGTHPTIMPLAKPIIEVHILDFSENLYGKEIFVEFVDFIRDEKRFNDLEELKQQLEIDSKFARKMLR